MMTSPLNKKGFGLALMAVLIEVLFLFLPWAKFPASTPLNGEDIVFKRSFFSSLNIFDLSPSAYQISNLFSILCIALLAVVLLAGIGWLVLFFVGKSQKLRIALGFINAGALAVLALVYVIFTARFGTYRNAECISATVLIYAVLLFAVAVAAIALMDGRRIAISKRGGTTLGFSVSVRAVFLLLALVVCAIVIFLIVDLNPLKVYVSMFNGAFGTEKRRWIMLRDLMILACIAVGLAPAFKMRFWNVGAEGQMLMGAIGATFFMRNFAGIFVNFGIASFGAGSGEAIGLVLLFVCMILAAIILGAIWGLIPGLFKAVWNANETLFTLMMNYIAIQFTSFCVAKWENPFGSNTVGIINSQTKYGWIGNCLSDGFNTDFLWTAIIVVAVAALMFCYLRYTKQGFEIAVVGDSENTAKYAGIRVKNVYIRTMAISGAVCGFAGFLAVSAISHTISTATAGGRGFTAIIVAWLAKMNPFWMLLIAALLTFLDKGAIQIASDFGLNEFASQIITGIVLFFILACEFFMNYKVSFHNITSVAATDSTVAVEAAKKEA